MQKRAAGRRGIRLRGCPEQKIRHLTAAPTSAVLTAPASASAAALVPPFAIASMPRLPAGLFHGALGELAPTKGQPFGFWRPACVRPVASAP